MLMFRMQAYKVQSILHISILPNITALIIYEYCTNIRVLVVYSTGNRNFKSIFIKIKMDFK